MKTLKKLWVVSVAALLLFTVGCNSSDKGDDNSSAKVEDTLQTILDRGELLIGLDAGYMPFEMRSKQGDIIGFDVDLAQEMAKAMGVKLKVVNTAFDGMIPALMTKKFDMIASAMTITPGRNLKMNFADPYITVGQSVLIRKELKGTIKSYKDLNNPKYKVSSKLGQTGEMAAKRMLPRAQYFSYETEQEAVMEVMNGKIDAFVNDFPFNAITAADKGAEKLHHLDTPFTFEPLAWGIRKNDVNFLNWLNNFMHQIRNDGTYDRIYAKWFKSSAWQANVTD